jgi:hypothetical protein
MRLRSRLLAVFVLSLWCVASAQSSDAMAILEQLPACAVSSSLCSVSLYISLSHNSKDVSSPILSQAHAVQQTLCALAATSSSNQV